jgi:hypothetical protein
VLPEVLLLLLLQPPHHVLPEPARLLTEDTTNGLYTRTPQPNETEAAAPSRQEESRGSADLLGELWDGVRELVVLEGGALGAAAHDLGRPRPAAAQAEMAARPRGRGGPPRTRGRRVRKEGGV